MLAHSEIGRRDFSDADTRALLISDVSPADRLRINLERSALDLHFCRPGAAAVAAAIHERPQLLLVDCRTDERTGLQLCSTLRSLDWNKSTVINSPLVAGSSNPKRCNAVAGTIQVCNERYGRTGWLGIASIWLSGGHISQGTTKVNDTYFNTAQYNTPSWRALVMCQEIGHDYGLGHQDEDFNTDSTESCMDYTNVPGGNEHPDAHDYEQLLAIYNHQESGVSISSRTPTASAEPGDTPAEWGRAVHFTRDGRPDVFVQDLGGGNRKITHVFWAIGEGPRNVRRQLSRD